MIKVTYVETQTNMLFVLLLLIPVTIVSASLVCVFCMNKKRLESVDNIHGSNNGYTKLLTTEDAILDFEDKDVFN